jgi:hypothetical protein
MKQSTPKLLPAIAILAAIIFSSCQKSSVSPSGLYTPTSSDASSAATLQELLDGRSFYISNCNNCHGLYQPGDYSSGQWSSILSSMGPRTNLTSIQLQDVKKYLSLGK